MICLKGDGMYFLLYDVEGVEVCLGECETIYANLKTDLIDFSENIRKFDTKTNT